MGLYKTAAEDGVTGQIDIFMSRVLENHQMTSGEQMLRSYPYVKGFPDLLLIVPIDSVRQVQQPSRC